MTEQEIKDELSGIAEALSDDIHKDIDCALSEMFSSDEQTKYQAMAFLAGQMATKLGALSLALNDLYCSTREGADIESKSQELFTNILTLAKESRGEIGYYIPRDMQ